MRHVRLHVTGDIALDIEHLRGEMHSRRKGQPPVFDDQRSFVLDVSSAEVAMNMSSLTHLMNDQVFAGDDAPLTHVELETNDDGRLTLKATLHKGIPIPISMKVTPAATPDGRLRLHIDSMKTVGIPAKGLLDLFGLEPSDLVNMKQRRGIEVTGDDIRITPGQIVPPPELRGHVAGARLEGGVLRLTYAPADGREPRRLTPPERNANYIFFKEGEIRFGKLLMIDADLQLIDMDPDDPFDFVPEAYDRQLVAGYSKNLPDKGLKTYMPDFDDLERHVR